VVASAPPGRNARHKIRAASTCAFATSIRQGLVYDPMAASKARLCLSPQDYERIASSALSPHSLVLVRAPSRSRSPLSRTNGPYQLSAWLGRRLQRGRGRLEELPIHSRRRRAVEHGHEIRRPFGFWSLSILAFQENGENTLGKKDTTSQTRSFLPV
jgi:hypothetical protein